MGCPTPGPLPAMGITLTRKERRELERTVRRATAAQRDVQRAKIALLVAEGWGNAAIARALGCAENTVRRWRRRFAERRREGLGGRPRAGGPGADEDSARTGGGGNPPRGGGCRPLRGREALPAGGAAGRPPAPPRPREPDARGARVLPPR